jgi:hypothetical protein
MFAPPWPQGYGYEGERPDVDGTKGPEFDYEVVDRLVVPAETGPCVRACCRVSVGGTRSGGPGVERLRGHQHFVDSE